MKDWILLALPKSSRYDKKSVAFIVSFCVTPFSIFAGFMGTWMDVYQSVSIGMNQKTEIGNLYHKVIV